MIFKPFYRYETGCASYLFGCGTLGKCAVVDPLEGFIDGSVCGAGMSGNPSSTIGFEKRFNPMLLMDKEAFVQALSDVPDKPADMEAIMRFNRGASAESQR